MLSCLNREKLGQFMPQIACNMDVLIFYLFEQGVILPDTLIKHTYPRYLLLLFKQIQIVFVFEMPMQTMYDCCEILELYKREEA